MSKIPAFPARAPADHSRRLADPARLETLTRSALMDSLPEEVFDRAVRLAQVVAGVPVSLFSIVDGERQFFKAAAGLEEVRETPLSHSFCQYVVTSESPLGVRDAREHPLLAENGAIEDLSVIAYLGVPVRAPDGQVLGSFCAIDGQPHDWSEAQLQAMKDIAGIVESEIRLHRALEERQLLVEELNHRVKNLFTLVSGLVRLSRGGKEPPEALDARISALARAHDLIAPVVQAGEAKAPAIGLRTLLETLLQPYLGDSVTLRLDGPEITLGSRAATPLALAFHELATNAAKYGALSVDHGRLEVTWAEGGAGEEDRLVLEWSESAGQGAPVAAPTPGFGSRLLSLSIEAQMEGTVETTLGEAGMLRRITLPLARLAQ